MLPRKLSPYSGHSYLNKALSCVASQDFGPSQRPYAIIFYEMLSLWQEPGGDAVLDFRGNIIMAPGAADFWAGMCSRVEYAYLGRECISGRGPQWGGSSSSG